VYWENIIQIIEDIQDDPEFNFSGLPKMFRSKIELSWIGAARTQLGEGYRNYLK